MHSISRTLILAVALIALISAPAGAQLVDIWVGGDNGNMPDLKGWASGSPPTAVFEAFGPRSVRDITLGPDGNIYVSASQSNKVQIYNQSGVFQSDFPISGLGSSTNTGADWGPDGLYHQLFQNDQTVRKFNLAGNQVGSNIDITADTAFGADVEVGPDRKIYISDVTGNAVRMYNPNGTFNSTIMTAGDGLDTPWGMTIRHGNLFVVNRGNNNVVAHNLALGTSSIFANHAGTGTLFWPAFAPDGSLWVSRVGTDGYNHNLVRWNGSSFDEALNKPLIRNDTAFGGQSGSPFMLFIVPEPATLGLLAMGGLLILRRQRRA